MHKLQSFILQFAFKGWAILIIGDDIWLLSFIMYAAVAQKQLSEKCESLNIELPVWDAGDLQASYKCQE